jgi:hypothetical protein
MSTPKGIEMARLEGTLPEIEGESNGGELELTIFRVEWEAAAIGGAETKLGRTKSVETAGRSTSEMANPSRDAEAG